MTSQVYLYSLLLFFSLKVFDLPIYVYYDASAPRVLSDAKSFITRESSQKVRQNQDFIEVSGADFESRFETAIRQGRNASPKQSFWTAYAFDVKPGVTIDGDFRWFGDRQVAIDASSGMKTYGTRNLAVFLLQNGESGGVTRIEVYNLDRKREYAGYPVYWLGRADNDQSVKFLLTFALSPASKALKVAERAVMAIALHDAKQINDVLRRCVQESSLENVRGAAVFWLGQNEGEASFIAGVARNEQEATEVRQQAIFVLGTMKDGATLAILKELYATSLPRELKKRILFAASIHPNEEDSVKFLIAVAERGDSEPEMRKQAIFWLGQKASAMAFKSLTDAVEKNDATTEVQKQAVFALSQRKSDEAIPALIGIAKTHPKIEVRKQAVFWLGQSGDERALSFLKETLMQR